jgi:hypothetical protein
MAITHLYALLTMNRQGWLTRGAKKKPLNLALILAWIGTMAIVAILVVFVYHRRF